jgi:hypothetical protein
MALVFSSTNRPMSTTLWCLLTSSTCHFANCHFISFHYKNLLRFHGILYYHVPCGHASRKGGHALVILTTIVTLSTRESGWSMRDELYLLK